MIEHFVWTEEEIHKKIYQYAEVVNEESILEELKIQERSIAWLSRRCGITRAYMHKMIHGKRNFSELYKKKCAEALKTNYDILFDA